jgi:hypothetical protein
MTSFPVPFFFLNIYFSPKIIYLNSLYHFNSNSRVLFSFLASQDRLSKTITLNYINFGTQVLNFLPDTCLKLIRDGASKQEGKDIKNIFFGVFSPLWHGNIDILYFYFILFPVKYRKRISSAESERHSEPLHESLSNVWCVNFGEWTR